MTSELLLRRKWTFRAHNQQVIFVKRPIEHTHHVLMKAFLWALYLPQYPTLKVEIKIQDRYKPDVVAFAPTSLHSDPLFWGEAGQVGDEKLASLLKRYRNTHFAIAKWNTSLRFYAETIQRIVADLQRSAPVDLLTFPGDSAERFIDDRGNIRLQHSELDWQRIT